MITRQAGELTHLKELLVERESSLAASQTESVDLALKASISKAHRIMFDDPWIVQTEHLRCKGAAPQDREGALLLALPGTLQAFRRFKFTLRVWAACGQVPRCRLYHQPHMPDKASVQSGERAGKLVLVGGQGKVEDVGRDVWCLELSSMTWQRPASAQQPWASVQASCCQLGRSKVRYRNPRSVSTQAFAWTLAGRGCALHLLLRT